MAANDLIRPDTLSAAAVLLAAALLVAWLRYRRVSACRETVRTLNALAEEILTAGSTGEIVGRLTSVLPKILGVTGVRVLLHDRAGSSLAPLEAPPGEARIPVSLDTAGDAGPVLAFRNRVLLAYPDFLHPSGPARAAVYVPMTRGTEVVGVLEAGHCARLRRFSPEERAAMQHLANQVAAALGLLEQRSVRERVFRTERLAASGELISGVASALRAPLDTISDLSRRLLERDPEGERVAEFQAIALAAQHAAETVDRLVSFSHADADALRPLDLLDLLRDLVDSRQREWAARGIKIDVLLPDSPARVLGVEGQLEQVFLSLLAHAEQAVAGEAEKVVTVSAKVGDGRVLVEISYPLTETLPHAEESRAPEAGMLGLAVCRGILRSCEGDIQCAANGPLFRFQVTFPLAAGDRAEASSPPRDRVAVPVLTLLVVEPDDGAGRRLLILLAERGHRAVIAPDGEEAIGLAERFRFDALLCAVRLPGTSWAGLFERVRGRVPACVLLTEGFDAALAREAGEKAYLVLSRPVAPDRLDQVLATIAARAVVE